MRDHNARHAIGSALRGGVSTEQSTAGGPAATRQTTPSLSLSDITFTEREISVGDRTWRIAAAEDDDALLKAAGDREPFPFGLLLWESAIVLSRELETDADGIRGRRVLELGCGVGLAGIVAAGLGATVTATDHDPLALELATRNAIANGVGGIRYRRDDWAAWTDDESYQLVMGADVVYDRAAHAAVLAILARNLAPGGTAIFADPGRHEQAAFIAAAGVAGFDTVSAPRPVPDLVRKDAIVDVTLVTLTKPRLSFRSLV